MNCRKLAKMMPELAAGELDSWLADDARKHLAECPACSALHSKYKADAQALRGPWEHVPVPDELAALQLPEDVRQPRRRLVPALALATILLAAVGGAVVFLHPAQDKRNENRAGLPNKPAPKHRVLIPEKHATVPVKQELRQPETIPPKTTRHCVERRPVRRTRPPANVNLQVKKQGPPARVNEEDRPTVVVDNTLPDPPAVGPRQVLMGESWMEITRVDPSTGAVTIYREKRRVSGGTDNVQLIQYEPEISKNQGEL